MEQKENPVDVGASIPDKENPYADLIMLLFDSSILSPLSLISDQLNDEMTNLFEFGLSRNQDGVFLVIFFETIDGVKEVRIPSSSALTLFGCICGAARHEIDPHMYPFVTAAPR